MSGEQYRFKGHGGGRGDGNKAHRLARTREAALERGETIQAVNPEPTVPPEVVVAPAEIATDPDAPITITRGGIELGQAFLRKARKEATLRKVRVQQVIAAMEDPYIKTLCIRVGGAGILVERAGRKMEDLESVDVLRKKAPDGTIRELLRCNYSPENSGQSFLDEFRKEP
jgi:hypothetical protein